MKGPRLGVILLGTLWVLVLTSLMALSLARKIVFMARVTRNQMQWTKAQTAVRSGLAYAMAALEDDRNSEVDSRLDLCFQNSKWFENRELAPGILFTIGSPDADPPYFGLSYLNDRLNINLLTPAMVQRILESEDIHPDSLAAVLDWIDADHDPYNNGDGAENDYYMGLSPPYPCRNGPINSWAELYLIKDMDESLADFLRNHFTLHGDGKVNLNVANRKTLQWLGLSETLIDKLERYFLGVDGLPGTLDDQIFLSMNEILPKLNEYESLYPDEMSELSRALPHLTLITTHFQVDVRAQIGGNLYPYQLSAVIERKDGKPVMVSNREFTAH